MSHTTNIRGRLPRSPANREGVVLKFRTFPGRGRARGRVCENLDVRKLEVIIDRDSNMGAFTYYDVCNNLEVVLKADDGRGWGRQ